MLTEEMLAPDTVLRVLKYRDEKEAFVGKVVGVRDTHAEPVTRKQRRRDVITRSQFLVMLESVDPATPEGERLKSYYHAFAEAEVVR